ncbi:MAG TPA: DNA alkylation repair protein [Paludibacter sp.]|nr:DNA alkylation repair protein [Paludibacter sp.]
MTSTELYNDLLAYCQANVNEANILKYQRYFKEVHNAYGLDTQQMNDKTAELLNKGLTLEVVLEALSEKLIFGKFEEVAFGISFIGKLSKQWNAETFDAIAGLFSKGIHNWAHADILGMNLLPDFILKGIVKPEVFNSWLISPYKFQRRCVPVSFIKIIKKEKEVEQYLDFIRPLMTDNEREVHQGVGWFLREAWKIQPEKTEEFLLEWKNISSRLIFQYACEKMTPEGKLKFKADKKTK